MNKKRIIRHEIQGVFIFVLLALFALMSILLVLFGTQVYRDIVGAADDNSQHRVLYSYVRSMVRAQDHLDFARVDTYEGGEALGMYETISGTEYVTWLYAWEGQLYEQFTAVSGELQPDHGVPIIEVTSFTPHLEGQLLTVDMVSAQGEEITVKTALHCET